MVVGIITCVCLVVVVVLGLIWCYQLRNEEIKTNKAKRSMYSAWYDLGVLIADIENQKLHNKEDK